MQERLAKTFARQGSISEADLHNFADNNSLSAKNKALSVVVEILQRNTAETLEWFNFNSMIVNPAKFQVMFLGIKDSTNLEFRIENNILKPTNFVKLLGVTIDSKLNFDQHIATVCSTASQKVKALFRILSFLDINCAKRLMDSYILSTFCYCPLIWMFCSKHSNNMIGK